YNPVLDTWTPITPNGAPSARGNHTAVWNGTEMIVWGGQNASSTCLNDGARYNPVLDTWTPITPNGAPSARGNHTAVWNGTEMIVWGGQNASSTCLNDGARYNPVLDTWTPITPNGAPSTRKNHTAVWDGTEMITFGGWDWSLYYNETHTYNLYGSPAVSSFSPPTALPGMVVTISGTNFCQVQSVLFNGISASFTTVSAWRIAATVPAGAMTGPIRVSTPAGTAVSANNFTLSYPPYISFWSPGGGFIGTSVTIIGGNFAWVTGVQFNGVDASFVVNSDFQITATVPCYASTGPVTLRTPVSLYTSTGSFPVVRPPVTLSTADEAGLDQALCSNSVVNFGFDGTVNITGTKAIIADTTLDGTGHNVTLDGGNTVRLFTVNPGVRLVLRKLTLANGQGITGGGVNNKGGIVTAVDCTFIHNTASGTWDAGTFSAGGAIYSCSNGTLVVSNSTFLGNAAYGAGGAAGGWGSAGANGRDAYGGAICSWGSMALVNCTFFQNGVTGGAGGAGGPGWHGYWYHCGLFSQCWQPGAIGGRGGDGGAAMGGSVHYCAYTYIGCTTGLVLNVTMANGAAYGGLAGASGTGGDINNGPGNPGLSNGGNLESCAGPLLIRNTIIANAVQGGNCVADFIDGGCNICSDASASFTSPTSHNSTNPLLAASLLGGEGPAPTLALLNGSPAINAGDDFAAPSTDQRHYLRVGQSDIGAYEFNGYACFTLPSVATLAVTGITSSNAVGGGEVTSDGGAPVLSRGLCWGLAANPTLADAVVTAGSGTGVFPGVALTNLTPATYYHVRAWATNTAGIAYGMDMLFGTACRITADTGPNGTISPSGTVEVAYGSDQTFAITADPGYHISDVAVDGSSVGATNSVVFHDVIISHMIHAVFQPDVPYEGPRYIGPWRTAQAVAGGFYHSLALRSDGSVLAWGYREYGQCDVPSPNADFMAVAGCAYHSMGLKSDGSVVAWGYNDYNQCDVPSPNADFVAIAGGEYHSMGLKSDGSVVAWGYNVDGACDLPSPNADFVAIAGGYHSTGLKSDGSVVVWGYSGYDLYNVPSPNSNFVAIAGGAFHSMGLKSDGSVVAWGCNDDGQCNVPSPNADFVAVAGGYLHSVGLKSDGSVVAWGCNDDGQCNVPSPNADFVAIAGGGHHSMGLKSDGSVAVWGRNDGGESSVPDPNVGFGQESGVVPSRGQVGGGTVVTIYGANLGDGSDVTNVTFCGVSALSILSQSPSRIVVQTDAVSAPTNGDVVVCSSHYGPVTRTNGFTYFGPPSVTTLAVSGITVTHAVGGGEVTADGFDPVTARGLCWGVATNPSLSDTFVTVGSGTGVFANVAIASLSSATLYHVRAWAANAAGVAYGTDEQFWTTCYAGARYIGPWRTASSIAEGSEHSLVLMSDGSIMTWGGNDYGQCSVPSPNSNFVSVARGCYHSLGLKSDGSVVAWGENSYGQCDVPSPNAGFVAVAGGDYHSLGLKSDGSVVAWGDRDGGPCDVPSPNVDFVALAGGRGSSLGLKSDGSVLVWGVSWLCDVPSPNSDYVAIAGGAVHLLGLKSDGSVVAWGDNSYGQCDVPSPNSNFVAVAGGGYHSLGLKADGSVVTWGANWFGQCDVPSPNSNFVAVAAGEYDMLGLKSDGSVVVWGGNWIGQCSVPDPNAGFGLSQGSGVVPSRGPVAGGTTVAVNGVKLGNGTDVTNVTVCGVPVAAILNQSPTRILVQTGTAPVPTIGDVVVYSSHWGPVARTNCFTYFTDYPSIMASAGPHGSISPIGVVEVPYGGSASFVAVADTYYHIAKISTNGAEIISAANQRGYTSIWMNVTAAGLVSAAFAENLTTNTGTPEWWLAQYGWTNN
ncbi:MAG: IPT/TIG domain-containing protein, partial [bacterium]